MGSRATLRFRRSAAQLHALVQVEREIRATDPHFRRKYLRDFNAAFQRYESVMEAAGLAEAVAGADILLVGDYHSLPASQQFTGELLADVARSRPVVLGVETVFARHQPALNEWLDGDIEEQELRERIRFDLDWSYDWDPFHTLLKVAKEHARAIYGLDCMPRNDLRRIAVRDRHAATKIADIRERHPDAAVVVLFGESHLAPNHLPELVRTQRPQDRLLTILQNVDPLYWIAAGEPREHVGAVRVAQDVVCVFNSTPLDKYESYRLCLERWRNENALTPDLAPSFYNLVDALARFLNIDKYSPTNHTQPRFLVDQLPDVYFRPSDERVRGLLCRRGNGGEDSPRDVLARLDEHGCCYVPQACALMVRNFDLVRGAEEAARFLHHACCGGPGSSTAEDRFYGRVLQDALGYFGSRSLYPGRPAVRESELYLLHAERGFRPEFTAVPEFLTLHKHYEANLRHYRERPQRLDEGTTYEGARALYAARQLGYMLGSELYDAYITGRVTRRFLRSLFFHHLDRPGAARNVYFATQRRLRRVRSQPGRATR